jgi:hypothetical protein
MKDRTFGALHRPLKTPEVQSKDPDSFQAIGTTRIDLR